MGKTDTEKKPDLVGRFIFFFYRRICLDCVNHVNQIIIITFQNQVYSSAFLNPPSLSQNLDFPRNFGEIIFFFDFLFTCFGQNISHAFNNIPHFPVEEVSKAQNLTSELSLTLNWLIHPLFVISSFPSFVSLNRLPINLPLVKLTH